MSTEGMGPCLAVEGSTTAEVFEAYLEHSLAPELKADHNPIEEVFSKIKGVLRDAQGRTRPTLLEAMGQTLSTVTAQDATGFFEHCGYNHLVGNARATSKPAHLEIAQDASLLLMLCLWQRRGSHQEER
jgi:hypothetical protein